MPETPLTIETTLRQMVAAGGDTLHLWDVSDDQECAYKFRVSGRFKMGGKLKAEDARRLVAEAIALPRAKPSALAAEDHWTVPGSIAGLCTEKSFRFTLMPSGDERWLSAKILTQMPGANPDWLENPLVSATA